MMTLLIIATLLLAAANGANDNIKGAATLVGSGLLSFRAAIAMATAATAMGGMLSLFLAQGLLAAFSGKGIVPQELVGSASFLLPVAVGAGLTVALATRLGMPVSTTHGLVGGLFGSGMAHAPDAVSVATTVKAMLAPLLISPLVAMVGAALLIPLVLALRRKAMERASCACVDQAALDAGNSIAMATVPAIVIDGIAQEACRDAPGRTRVALSPDRWLDGGHVLSALAVSTARGLNDTPKIAALLAGGGMFAANGSTMMVVGAMAAGGLLAAGPVARTLAHRVTRMDASEGLAANVVTALLVTVASRFGLPVSTTHVSTGALFGIASRNRSGQWPVIRQILLSWLATLPLAGLIAYLTARLLLTY